MRMRRRLGIMALRRGGRCFPKSFHVVDVGHVGFNVEASCRDVVWVEFIRLIAAWKCSRRTLRIASISSFSTASIKPATSALSAAGKIGRKYHFSRWPLLLTCFFLNPLLPSSHFALTGGIVLPLPYLCHDHMAPLPFGPVPSLFGI